MGPDRTDEAGSFLNLIGLVVKWRRLVIAMTLFAAAGAVLFSIGSLALPPDRSYLPNVFEPQASILVSDKGSDGLSSLLGDASGLAALAGLNVSSGSSSGDLAVVLAKSNTTLDELNSVFDLTGHYRVTKNPRADTRRATLRHLSVAYTAKTGILTISFSDYDPDFAQRVVNKVVEILDRRFASIGGSRALQQKTWLEGRLADVQLGIKDLEAKSEAFTAKYGVVSVDALATEQVTVLARLRSELIMKDMEIENYQKFSNIDDPVIRRLRSERQSLEAKVHDLDSGSGGLIPSQRELPGIAFEYAAIQRDLMVQGEIYKLLTQQYEMAKLNAEGQEPALQVLELAEVPDKKAGPSRSRICVAATAGGFVLAIIVALLLNWGQSIRKDPQAMRRLRGIG